MFYVFLAQIESTLDTTISSAERLAKGDDRVLFLATLILFFIAGGVAVWWFMKQLDKRDIALRDQQKEHQVEIAALHKELGQVREQFNAYLIGAANELRSIVTRNSEVIERNTKVIEESTHMSERKMSILSEIEKRMKEIPATGRLIQ